MDHCSQWEFDKTGVIKHSKKKKTEGSGQQLRCYKKKQANTPTKPSNTLVKGEQRVLCVHGRHNMK